MRTKKINFLAVLSIASVLISCSKNEADSVKSSTSVTESSSATAVSGYLSGTAAIGAPLGVADVLIQGQTGTCNSIPLKGKTNSIGVFSVNVSSCTGPYIITVSSSLGKVQAVAVDSGVVANVTPLTQLIAQRAIGSTEIKLSNVLAVSNLENALSTKETEIKTVLKEYAKAVGAASSAEEFENYNLRSGAFSANGNGVDKFLDSVKFEVAGSNINIKLADSVDAPTSLVTFAATGAAPSAIDATTATSKASLVSDKLEMLAEIKKYTTNFSNIFKNSLPTRSQFDQFISSQFLNRGKNADQLFEDIASDSEAVGIQFRNVVVLNPDPSNFWVSFQIFGIENGKYVLWNTWVSKIEDLEGSAKLLGNQMPFGLTPTFIKESTYSSSNTLTHAATYRALEFYTNETGDADDFTITKIDDQTLASPISIVDGQVVSPSSRSVSASNGHFFKLTSSEALKSIVKITYKEGSSNVEQDSYIFVNQPVEEISNLYMDLVMPSFDIAPSASTNCSWNKNTLLNADENQYEITNQNWEYANFTLYTNGGDLYNQNIDNLLSEFQIFLTSTLSSVSTVRMTKAVLNQDGPSDVRYTHIYKCN